ncbi:MAG: S53 family peptidase, partial [Acidobacteriota bacterium]
MKSRLIIGFVGLYLATTAFAQQDRVRRPVNSTQMRELSGNIHPLAQAQFDQGPVDLNQDLPNLTLLFKPSAAQQADLDRTLADLQNPASPDFRKWFTPETYADRFGVSPNDAAAAVAWLQSEGFTVSQVARGRGFIRFSGTAARAATALRTQIRRYRVNGQTRYANSTEPSIPAALTEIVAGIRGLDNFKLTSHHRIVPNFNLSSDKHALAPDDLSKIYDLDPLYQVGIDGTGQKLAIIGETDIDITDIQKFRQRFGLPSNDPQVVPASFGQGIVDEELAEADLDLEWAGAIARNAKIFYVTSSDVVTSAAYAIDNNVAPVMSMSYGGCEARISIGLALRTLAQQAAAQGITWLVSSGDAGAAGCDRQNTAPQTARGLGVSIFAAFPEVTGVGGTMFDDAVGNYWANTNGATLASAKSYIPEKGWNENDAAGLFSSGGGASILFSKPAWQTGPGVPNDQARDVPDI